MVVGVFTIPLLSAFIVSVLIPEWNFMSCEGMLEFNSSDRHSELNEEQHLQFHQHYFEKCVNEDVG